MNKELIELKDIFYIITMSSDFNAFGYCLFIKLQNYIEILLFGFHNLNKMCFFFVVYNINNK